MSREAMLPCIVCGTVLDNVFDDSTNQPSDGTEFTTFGHYGSTFWDSFGGEQIVINVCDECLRSHTARIGRQKRWVGVEVDTEHGRVTVGRQWVDREMVPWFDGPEDNEPVVVIEPEEIGVFPDAYGRIEWAANWWEIKTRVLAEEKT